MPDHLFCFKCGEVRAFLPLDFERSVFVCTYCSTVRDLGDDFDEAD